MAMLEGTVTINPVDGSIIAKTGCAGEVFDAMEAGQDYGDTPATNPPAYAAARQQIANLAKAVAKVVPHIQANAVVSTNVNTTVATGIPVATAGTAAAQTGATTAPGAGTGSGTGTVA